MDKEPFVTLEFIPPTSNNIYVTGRGGMRFLSKEAKNFKLRAISYIQSECMAKISKLNKDGIYQVRYEFYFMHEDIINKTWNSGKKDGAQSRYKRMDVENRVKLVADALSTSIGIDDCQFFEGSHVKLSAALVNNIPQVKIFITEVSPEQFGVPNGRRDRL